MQMRGMERKKEREQDGKSAITLCSNTHICRSNRLTLEERQSKCKDSCVQFLTRAETLVIHWLIYTPEMASRLDRQTVQLFQTVPLILLSTYGQVSGQDNAQLMQKDDLLNF